MLTRIQGLYHHLLVEPRDGVHRDGVNLVISQEPLVGIIALGHRVASQNLVHGCGVHIGDGSNAQIGDLVDCLDMEHPGDPTASDNAEA